MTAIFLSQSGLIIWSNIKQVSSRFVIEHRKQISTRDTITLSHTAINDNRIIVWLEKDEVRYLGNMFDIQFIIKSTKLIKLVGHYDGVENELFNLLSKLLETDKKRGSNNCNKFLFEFSDAILSYANLLPKVYENTINTQVFSFVNILYSSQNTDNDIKPPEYTSLYPVFNPYQ